jgi:outer membrane protein OmpA-like peptidoglycan-associated protein
MLNSHTNEVAILKTNPEGYFESPVQKGLLYIAKAMMPDYLDDCLTFRFQPGDTATAWSIPRDLLLDKYVVNKVFKIENIYYDLDKWYIRPDAQPALDNLVRNMKQSPISIELSSHTDSRASDEYNMELSFKRAESAVRYLTLNGIDPARITAKGYGETMLVNQCKNGVPCSEAEHQANRRTEFKITSVETRETGKESGDLSLFIEGDIIPVQLLEPGFFKGCLEYEKTLEKEEIPGRILENERVPVPQPFNQEPPVTEPEANQSNVMGETFFTIQIYAVEKPADRSKLDFKGEEPVLEKEIGQYIKYFTGKFDSFERAVAERKRLQAKFPGCFIVGFIEGEVIPASDLKKILN